MVWTYIWHSLYANILARIIELETGMNYTLGYFLYLGSREKYNVLFMPRVAILWLFYESIMSILWLYFYGDILFIHRIQTQ